MSEHTPTPWMTQPCGEALPDDVMIVADRGFTSNGIQIISTVARCLSIRQTPEMTKANAAFIVEAVNSFQALKDENDRLKKDRNIQKAHSALRGRILQEVRDRIGPLRMGLEDEGDRIYLGSTNDKDWLTEIEETIFEVDDEVWATLNREEADPYQDLYDLRVNRIPALKDEIAAKDERIARLEEALKRLAILTPARANARDARDLHITVKAIADTALDCEVLRDTGSERT